MSDEPAPEATIPLEDNDGASTPLPPELALPAEPATPPVPETPAAEPPGPVDPEKQGLLATLGRERHENKTLKQFRDQAGPLLVALQKHPDLLAEIQARETGQRPTPSAPRPAPEPASTSPFTDADIEQYARDMVLYKPDGSGLPDTDAARRILASNEKQVQAALAAAIRQHVAPIQQTMQRSQGQSSKETISQFAKTIGADGPELDNLLDNFLASDPTLLSNPQVAFLTTLVARGMKGLPVEGLMGNGNGQAPAVPVAARDPATGQFVPGGAPAPVFTERPGARVAEPAKMSSIEQRTAKSRGITPEQWQTAIAPLVNAAKGQHHIVLEDD